MNKTGIYFFNIPHSRVRVTVKGSKKEEDIPFCAAERRFIRERLDGTWVMNGMCGCMGLMNNMY